MVDKSSIHQFDYESEEYEKILNNLPNILKTIPKNENPKVVMRGLRVSGKIASMIFRVKPKEIQMDWNTRFRGRLVLVGASSSSDPLHDKAFAIATLRTTRKTEDGWVWVLNKVTPIRRFKTTSDEGFFEVTLPMGWENSL